MQASALVLLSLVTPIVTHNITWLDLGHFIAAGYSIKHNGIAGRCGSEFMPNVCDCDSAWTLGESRDH